LHIRAQQAADEKRACAHGKLTGRSLEKTDCGRAENISSRMVL